MVLVTMRMIVVKKERRMVKAVKGRRDESWWWRVQSGGAGGMRMLRGGFVGRNASSLGLFQFFRSSFLLPVLIIPAYHGALARRLFLSFAASLPSADPAAWLSVR